MDADMDRGMSFQILERMQQRARTIVLQVPETFDQVVELAFPKIYAKIVEIEEEEARGVEEEEEGEGGEEDGEGQPSGVFELEQDAFFHLINAARLDSVFESVAQRFNAQGLATRDERSSLRKTESATTATKFIMPSEGPSELGSRPCPTTSAKKQEPTLESWSPKASGRKLDGPTGGVEDGWTTYDKIASQGIEVLGEFLAAREVPFLAGARHMEFDIMPSASEVLPSATPTPESPSAATITASADGLVSRVSMLEALTIFSLFLISWMLAQGVVSLLSLFPSSKIAKATVVPNSKPENVTDEQKSTERSMKWVMAARVLARVQAIIPVAAAAFSMIIMLCAPPLQQVSNMEYTMVVTGLSLVIYAIAGEVFPNIDKLVRTWYRLAGFAASDSLERESIAPHSKVAMAERDAEKESELTTTACTTPWAAAARILVTVQTGIALTAFIAPSMVGEVIASLETAANNIGSRFHLASPQIGKDMLTAVLVTWMLASWASLEFRKIKTASAMKSNPGNDTAEQEPKERSSQLLVVAEPVVRIIDMMFPTIGWILAGVAVAIIVLTTPLEEVIASPHSHLLSAVVWLGLPALMIKWTNEDNETNYHNAEQEIDLLTADYILLAASFSNLLVICRLPEASTFYIGISEHYFFTDHAQTWASLILALVQTICLAKGRIGSALAAEILKAVEISGNCIEQTTAFKVFDSVMTDFEEIFTQRLARGIAIGSFVVTFTTTTTPRIRYHRQVVIVEDDDDDDLVSDIDMPDVAGGVSRRRISFFGLAETNDEQRRRGDEVEVLQTQGFESESTFEIIEMPGGGSLDDAEDWEDLGDAVN